MHKQQRGVYVFKNIFYTRLLEIMVLFVYKTNAIRPMLQDQDQDCSLQDARPIFIGLRPVLSQDRGLRPHHW